MLTYTLRSGLGRFGVIVKINITRSVYAIILATIKPKIIVMEDEGLAYSTKFHNCVGSIRQ